MISNEESRRTAYLAAQLEHLALRAVKSGVVLYSDFLSLPEQKLATTAAKHAGCSIMLYGGTKDSQRKVAAFSKDEGLLAKEDFPLVILKASFDTRFLKAELSHRDFLGALMGLAIRREMVGDIVIGEGEAYLFVLEKSYAYLLAELDSVGRASVTLTVEESCPLSAAPNMLESTVTVSSMRLDCVVTQIMRVGRNTACEAIAQSRVRVDDVTAEKPDRIIKEGQEISVKGFGKYRIGAARPTKKGRLAVTVLKYN